MDLESLREYCLSFANATEDIQWGDDLLFRVGGKIFAVLDLGEASTVHAPIRHRAQGILGSD
ncbi:MAG: MmcQ/YjbR family DNA-binding protein [Gemmatimonadetes bacterium]|nr:MmcQ/YjbR family DNA-binding protein [Gemmatimonadota bacterium]